MNIESVSFVVPCYNEEEVLDAFYERVAAFSRTDAEREYAFIFVNDGSEDRTREILDRLATMDERVKVLHLAKNCGHQAAITAGIDFAQSDLVITIDADLQDPPEVAKEMVERAEQGFDIIHAQRNTRVGEPPWRLFAIGLFYKIMKVFATSKLIENCGDFRAFTRRVQESMNHYREPHRYLRGLFVEVGFRQSIVRYDRDARFAGVTKYPLRRLIQLALNGAVTFSTSPIRLITYMAVFMWGLSLMYLAFALTVYFLFPGTIEAGWTSLVLLMFFFSGLQLFSIGILGAYIGRIFEQGQRRPLYWVESCRNIQLRNPGSLRAGPGAQDCS